MRLQTLSLTAKEYAKKSLEQHGWYVRKAVGLSSGVDCFLEIRNRFGAKLDVVFDVGAHRVETVLEVIKRFPQARIFAFEPVAPNFRALESTCSSLPNVICHRLALGDRDGSEDIFIQDDTQTHTLKHSPMSGTTPPVTAAIEIATLDRFFESCGIPKIDLLKIDVEGYELEVLAGARRTLKRNPPRLILAEASLDPSDQIHTPLGDIVACLSPYGYRLLSIYDQVVWRSPMRLAYFNALFAHK